MKDLKLVPMPGAERLGELKQQYSCRDYHIKNWKDAFYEMFGYVGAYAESHPDAKRMYDYMKHVRDDVISFDEFDKEV